MQILLNPLNPQWGKAHQKPVVLYSFLYGAFLTKILEYLFPRILEIQDVRQNLGKALHANDSMVNP